MFVRQRCPKIPLCREMRVNGLSGYFAIRWWQMRDDACFAFGAQPAPIQFGLLRNIQEYETFSLLLQRICQVDHCRCRALIDDVPLQRMLVNSQTRDHSVIKTRPLSVEQ